MRVGCFVVIWGGLALALLDVFLDNVEGKVAAYLVSHLQSPASGCRDRLGHPCGVVVVLVILVTADMVQGLQ